VGSPQLYNASSSSPVHRSGGAPSSPGGAHDLSSPLPYGSQTTPVSTPRVNPHPRHAWPLPTLLCECPPLSRVLIVNQSLFRMRVVSGPTWPLHEATWDSEPTGWSSTSPQGARTTHHRLRATMAETPTVDPPSPRTLPATSTIFALLSWSHLSSSVLSKSLSLSLARSLSVCVRVSASLLFLTLNCGMLLLRQARRQDTRRKWDPWAAPLFGAPRSPCQTPRPHSASSSPHLQKRSAECTLSLSPRETVTWCPCTLATPLMSCAVHTLTHNVATSLRADRAMTNQSTNA
jgi:hypothetical protein